MATVKSIELRVNLRANNLGGDKGLSPVTHTARRYLNSLCEGENPRLRKKKEGTVMHYLPVKKK